MDSKQAKEQTKLAVKLLKLIAHEARFSILCELVEGEKTAGELQKYTELSQSAFSQHLSVLRKQGIIKARREGLYLYYAIANKQAARLMNILHEIYCEEEV